MARAGRRATRRTAEPSAQTWWYGFFARLWQFLTVAGREGDDLTGGSALALVLVGLGVAARRWRDGGLAVVAGAVVGVAGVEAFYHLMIRRWSVGRYDIMGWPFMVVAAALALDVMLRGRRRYLGAAVALALGVAHIGGVLDYQVRGREQWHRMAEVVRRVRLPGEPILTENIFCQYGLTYDVLGPGAWRDGLPADAPIPLDRDLDRLRRSWPQDRSCLLVRGGTPLSPEVRRGGFSLPGDCHLRREQSAVPSPRPVEGRLERSLPGSGSSPSRPVGSGRRRAWRCSRRRYRIPAAKPAGDLSRLSAPRPVEGNARARLRPGVDRGGVAVRLVGF